MTRFSFWALRCVTVGFLGAALLGLPAYLCGGPVPGVETFDKKPVLFPVSPSMNVWDIGNDEYLVTFRWKTNQPKPGVAGEFNSWSRTDLPMSGPDADGFYSVTARVKAGEYRYKFVSGDDGWQGDEANPDRDSDSNGNSILRVGISAELHGKVGKLDDQIITRAVTHDPKDYHYLDFITADRAIVRVRTLANDVASVALEISATSADMTRIAKDAQFDYWETTTTLPHESSAEYNITLVDGTAKEALGPFNFRDSSLIRFHTPEWTKSAIWYQIVVDRFRDGEAGNNPEHTLGSGRTARTWPWGSDFFAAAGGQESPAVAEAFKADADKDNYPDIWQRLYGGDFQGVIDKLDYLNDLGINALYLNPIFESTSHHKYNAKTYQFADDGYGIAGEFAKSMETNNVFAPSLWKNNKSDEKFFQLLAAAKKKKMRVIIDGVFNHLGDNSPYFVDVKNKGKKSPYADWFDVLSFEPFKYRGWAGAEELPQFKKDMVHGIASDSARKFIFDCTKKWMDPNGDGDPSDGIDGWRLDVPMDVPMPFWDDWCAYVRSINPNAYIVGEVWSPAEEWIDGKKFDAVMNYQFRVAALRYFGNVKQRSKASDFDNDLARLRIRYPMASTMAMQNLLDSHDTDRIASRLNNPDLTGDRLYDGQNRVQDANAGYDATRPRDDIYKRLKLLALFQATYIGAPMIYYGTEVGMFGADDPMCRNPMWWSDIKFDNADYRINNDLLEEYQKLFKLRGSQPALAGGEFQTLLADDAKDVFVFHRFVSGTEDSDIVVINNSDAAQTVTLSNDRFGGGRLKLLHGDSELDSSNSTVGPIIKIAAVSGAIYSTAGCVCQARTQ